MTHVTACWLPRTGISSGTLRSVIDYGLPLPLGLLGEFVITNHPGWQKHRPIRVLAQHRSTPPRRTYSRRINIMSPVRGDNIKIPPLCREKKQKSVADYLINIALCVCVFVCVCVCVCVFVCLCVCCVRFAVATDVQPREYIAQIHRPYVLYLSNA